MAQQVELDLKGVHPDQLEHAITKAMRERAQESHSQRFGALSAIPLQDEPPALSLCMVREFGRVVVSPRMNDDLRACAPWNHPDGGILFCDYMDGKGPRMKFGNIVVEIDANLPPDVVILK